MFNLNKFKLSLFILSLITSPFVSFGYEDIKDVDSYIEFEGLSFDPDIDRDLMALNPDSGNSGHRAGYRSFIKIPENSLEGVDAAFGGIIYPGQYAKDFNYLEFDIRETFDNRLVIFHDSVIDRMLPKNLYNLAIFDELLEDDDFADRMRMVGNTKFLYKKIRVHHLTLEELQRFQLKDSARTHVPSMIEFFNRISKYEIRKPIAIEIKYIYSQKARENFYNILETFYNDTILPGADQVISEIPALVVIAFKGRFEDSFGDTSDERAKWCSRLIETGAKGVFKCKTGLKENLCDKYLD